MSIQNIDSKIYEIRGVKVMLDRDLALLYRVPTKSLNLAVKRNLRRFPADFMFQLTGEEWDYLRFHFETLDTGRGKHTKYLPYAFTEQGIAMLSGVLHSDTAIDANIAIMRTFAYIRQFALSHRELSDKLKELEEKFDRSFCDISEAINYLLKKEVQQTEQSGRKRIGY